MMIRVENTTNTPRIETDRLILRKFVEEDVDYAFEILRDEEVNTFLPWYPIKDKTKARLHLEERYFNNYNREKSYHYAVCLKENNIPIGYINVSDNDSYDLGYGLKKEFWGNGIITEGCNAVIEVLKRDKIPYITATHDINNIKSGNVMKRLGMEYKYSYKEIVQPKNFLVTFRMYQLNLSGEYGTYSKYWDLYNEHFIEKYNY